MRPALRPVMQERMLGAGSRLHLGQCVLDLQARELRTPGDQPVELRPKALDVLLVLAEQPGRVVDKKTLMDRVWTGVVVGDDSLTQTIVEIRRALDDRGHRVLCTVARRGYRLQPSETSAPAPVPSLSIAVLPITHTDAEPDSVHCANALTAELTARAGVGLPDAKVVARETVSAMGGVVTDPRAVARQLGVQQVLCGELRAVAGGWTLMLSVVDGVSGARRWSHRFALAHTALPQQIGEVAAQAARALLVEMHRTAAEVAARRPLSERSVGELALQGWARLYDGISPSNLEQAQQLFDQAVEKDPLHLRGLGGVLTTNYWRAQLGWASDRTLAHQRVLDTAARLEKLYPDETLTAFSRGSAADIERRWDLRLSIYDRLCERDPANSTAHFGRACGLLKLGRFDECVVEINEARRLSVDDFRAGWWCSFAACAELMAGRHEQAATEAQRAIAANACLPLPPLLLAAALERDGRSAEGRDILRQHRLREPLCDRAYVEVLLGAGSAAYEDGCAQFISTLAAMGLASRQSSQSVSDVHR